MRKKDWIDWFAYLGVRLFIAVIQALPLETCEKVSRFLAWLAFDALKIRRKVVEDNLMQAFPGLSKAEMSHIAKNMWAHLFLMVCEIAHAPRKIHITNWREHSDVPDAPEIIRPLLSDRPSIVLSGHFGNFELGGYLLGLFGFPTHTIARKLDNRYLDDFVNSFRGATGQYILPKDGSREQIAELLHNGGTLTLLGDQAAGDRACWVDFFGRPASTHKAVAVFSLSAEAPMLVTFVRRRGAPLHYTLGLAGVVDPLSEDFSLGSVQELAQWYTKCLEEAILKAPEQYWWLHRRWKGQPTKAALRRMTRVKERNAA